MYGLPKNINLNFILNKAITSICIGQHHIILYFEDELHFYIGNDCKFVSKDKSTTIISDNKNSASVLIPLLESTITHYQTKENGDLILYFDSNDTLYLYDDSPNFESYLIKYGDIEIVV